jgi:phospholipid-binding lipoprotein MlaA
MIFKSTASPGKPFWKQAKCFHLYCFVLGLLILPTSSFAAYFSGPPEILAALQFNSQGEVVFDSQDLPQDSLQTQADESANPPAVDPYSDEAIEDDDPFGDDAGSESDLEEEDPFADEEKQIANMPDPFERWYNRPVYAFNDHFYEYFLRPVAQTYKDLLAENFRIMIRNLYYTITFPIRLVSSLLQFKFEKSGRVISRVLINCTLGFACMVDVADGEFGIKPVDEDFGQVLGFYGIPSGPYLVLPLLGPSSLRDGVGRAVDALLNPLFWLVPDFTTGAAITSEQIVNETSFYIEDIKALKEGAIDPYESLRDFYNQRREILVDE